MTAAIIDLSLIRARKATGQPPEDKPAGVIYRHPEAVFVPGDWVKTPTGLIGVIAEFRVIGGVIHAFLMAGQGIRQAVPVKDLARTGPNGGAA